MDREKELDHPAIVLGKQSVRRLGDVSAGPIATHRSGICAFRRGMHRPAGALDGKFQVEGPQSIPQPIPVGKTTVAIPPSPLYQVGPTHRRRQVGVAIDLLSRPGIGLRRHQRPLPKAERRHPDRQIALRIEMAGYTATLRLGEIRRSVQRNPGIEALPLVIPSMLCIPVEHPAADRHQLGISRLQSGLEHEVCEGHRGRLELGRIVAISTDPVGAAAGGKQSGLGVSPSPVVVRHRPTSLDQGGVGLLGEKIGPAAEQRAVAERE